MTEVGAVFGKLTYLAPGGPENPRKALFRCECGVERVLWRQPVRSGRVKSCGCWQREYPRTRKGKPRPKVRFRTRTYGSWAQMKTRCNNPANNAYDRYGGRGIVVCERWTSFDNFLADMGECPPGMTVERINNNGNYEPGNCRWATYEEQGNNKRNNVTITHNGVTKTQAQWAKELGVSNQTMINRRNAGWSVEKLLTPRRREGSTGRPPYKQTTPAPA